MHGAFHFRFFKAQSILLSPAAKPSSLFDDNLRAKQSITRAELTQTRPDEFVTKTPRARRFKQTRQPLANVSDYSPASSHIEVLREIPASPYKPPSRKRKRKQTMISQERAARQYPNTPNTPFKAVIIKIDCTKNKTRGSKVKGNNQVMGNLPATNAYSIETFLQATETNKENPGLRFEHNHLSANHFKRYACEAIYGDVDPKHPDNPANLAEALKQTNSQMMKAELVVDGLVAKVQEAFREGTLKQHTHSYQPIESDNTAFTKAFNNAMIMAEPNEVLIGVNVSLLRDSDNDITHCADQIEYHIGWNRHLISFQIDAKSQEYPTWNEIQQQRDYLERFFRDNFENQASETVTASAFRPK